MGSMSTVSFESKFGTPTEPMAKRLTSSGAYVIRISSDTPYHWWRYLQSWQSIERCIFFYENRRTPSTKLSKYLDIRSAFPPSPSHSCHIARHSPPRPATSSGRPLWPSSPPQTSPSPSLVRRRRAGGERRQTAPTARRPTARPSVPRPRPRPPRRRIRRAA